MAPIIEQPHADAIDVSDPMAVSPDLKDVPGLMVDRVGKLYAEEERASRLARTARLIHQAEDLH
jgi:hypothetical protein